MKISIITPTHNTRFLKELEKTIMAQTYGDWEWVILLNGGAQYTPDAPPPLRDSPCEGETIEDVSRIKIIECPFNSDSVGFLKHLACMNATGDVIAEVDHDDLLTTDCLAKVAKAFEEEGVGFVFSQNAKLSKDFRPYMEECGWTHKKFKWEGRSLFAMNNQPVTPGRLGQIWFAPDHIRAWRRDVYEQIGGHDDSLKVCDDLDLMHRLYLVTKFKEIEEVLYVYRITGDNTYQMKGDLIRQMNERLYDANIEKLARRFCEINGVDVVQLQNPLGLRPLPLEGEAISALKQMQDNSAGLVVADDTLQYVADQREVMSEIHRVLIPGGILLSRTPSTDGRAGFQDPTVKSYWNENSFWYYTKANYARKINNSKLFRECKLTTNYPDEYSKKHKMAYVVAHLEKL
jgi:O-antigen biosynthesis protein